MKAEDRDRDSKVIIMKMDDAVLPDLAFKEYQRGLRINTLIHVLFDNTTHDPNGSDAALIKYLPGAFTPRHMHMGWEIVLVLEGEYVENDVSYGPGALFIKAPGSIHELRSDTGCTIFAMRDIPVRQMA